MNDSQANNKRIAKNTLLLYFRMLLTMAISLYTSRAILQVLGVDDFGIYNVVGGVVAMFGFINGAMTSAVQRYITFAQGSGTLAEQQKVFSCSVNVQACIALIITVLAETIGLWFFYNKMVIPADRMMAAFWVYQASIASSIVLVMTVPYNASIIAHERMSAFAYISIFEVTMKLLIVYLLLMFSADKLILYAALILVVQLSICLYYRVYCKRNFEEVKYKFIPSGGLFKEMVSFASWSLFGNLSAVAFTQGLNVLLNMFFGPAVNAARAIAVQVQGAINLFSSNFQMAINPQITKTYAASQYEDMHKLVQRSCKFTFMMLYVLCLPVFFEAPLILEIWLKTVPDYTVVFLRIILITMIVDSTANPLMVSAAATGKIKLYQSVIGSLLLAILPISYIVLRLGAAPWAVFVVHLAICCLAFIVRLFIIRPMIKLSIMAFMKTVIKPCFIVTCPSLLVAWLFRMLMPQSTLSSLCVIAFCVLCAATACYFIGLDTSERALVNSKLQGIVKKISRK